MNVAIYLPRQFYSTAASVAAETLLAMNAVKGEEFFKLSFFSKTQKASTKLGISYPVTEFGTDRIDLLILLAGHTDNLMTFENELEEESKFAKQVIDRTLSSGGVIAGTCSASLLMAKAGVLNGKRATVAWWAKDFAKELFPKVKWDASRIIVRHGNVFTSGGILSAFDLMTTVLVRLGFSDEVRTVRKLLVAPPGRELQSIYEIDWSTQPRNEFEAALHKHTGKIGLAKISIATLADGLACSEKTLTRRFRSELETTPGKWIQARRLSKARELLETTNQSVGKLCSNVGYEDQASFTRLFFKIVGVTPTEYRKQTRI